MKKSISLWRQATRKTAGKRFVFFLLGDAVLLVMSLYLAMLLRFEFRIPPEHLASLRHGVLLALATKVPIFYLFRTQNFHWSFVSVRELMTTFKASLFGSLLFAASLFFMGGLISPRLPRSIPILDAIISFLFIGGFRSSKRFYMSAMRAGRLSGPNTLIVGAGNAGEQLVRSLQRLEAVPYGIIGFVDDSPAKQGCSIHGIRVLGTRSDIPRVAKEHGVKTLLIAIPSAVSKIMRTTVELARRGGIRDIRTLPAFSDIISGKIGLNDIREVNLEDLLGRQPVSIDTTEIRRFFQGKTVLVTGAGGSIGSELCRQLSRFNLRALVMLDHEETALFNIHRELLSLDMHPLYPILGTIQDRKKVASLFENHRPQVILHAAAYKHVRMMNLHPDEAVKNNVLGTQILGELAAKYWVDQFVLISTDKAVNPTGVMGASKRVAEMVVMNLHRAGPTRFMAVRFGNVLGSRGSVLPIFREQLRRGAPITVTDPQMKRYFMIPSEAALLVLQSAAMGQGGEVFVLDMGDPVKIYDLAKELIRLAGLEPEKDVPIVFTGAAPEEKLFEDILTAEEGTVATHNNRIYRARLDIPEDPEFAKKISRLVAFSERKDADGIDAVLRELVASYRAQSAPKSIELPQAATESV